MNKLSVLLLSALLFLSACHTASVKKSPAVAVEYDEQTFVTELERVRNRSADADFTQLRLSYTDTSNYAPYRQQSAKPIFELMNKGEFQACIDEADAYLQTNFTSMPAHYASLICHSELKHDTEVQFHQYVLDGLMESIYASGDGRNAETAFIIISTDELYTFLELNGLKATAQALVHENGKAYDKMDVVNPVSNSAFSLYFDVSLQMSKGMRFLD